MSQALILEACKCGDLGKLRSLELQQITVNNILTYSCMYNNIDIVKFILPKKLEFNLNTEFEFAWACRRGYLELAKLLLERDVGIDIHCAEEFAFIYACANGHLNVAQWLYSLDGKINIHERNNVAFKLACFEKKEHVVKWLCEIYPYKYIIVPNKLIPLFIESVPDIVKKGHFEIAKGILNLKTEIYSDICPVCLEEDRESAKMDCGHIFCYKCMLKWRYAEGREDCPLCRRGT